jgi:hypothetical protein
MFGQQRGALHQMAEFAHVARPRIRLQCPLGRGRQTQAGAAIAFTAAGQARAGQRQDVVATVT